MIVAGYTKKEALKIRDEVTHYHNVREEIKLASGDYIDLKAYEPAMRRLIDTYISAEESEKISAFDDLTLVELIVQNGIFDTVSKLGKNIRKNNDTVAAVIENNVRRLIIEERPINPKFYENMSLLLKDIIAERKNNIIEYKQYLDKIAELCKKLKKPQSLYPKKIDSLGKMALYDNLSSNVELSIGSQRGHHYE